MKPCISSATYTDKLAGAPKLSAEDKKNLLAKILKENDERTAMHKIGQGMIGPIQVRLRYEGMVRNVLVEDTLDRGPIIPYDIVDDLGQAYILNQTDSEVKIQMFEGKQATPSLFRIASFPRVRKEDLYYLRVNLVEYAQDESRQAIMKQEDYRLIVLLEQAIVGFGVNGPKPTGGYQTGISAGPAGFTNEKTVLVGSGSPLEPIDFYSAVSMVEIEQVEANRVLAHPQDLRDIYTWDINTTGWALKDKIVGGEKVTSFGEFELQRSVMVPQGELFLTAAPEFVGVFPVMYSLDVEENHQVETFYKGWVMDELIGMLVLNSRGLARILKSDSYAASGINTTNGLIQNRGLFA